LDEDQTAALEAFDELFEKLANSFLDYTEFDSDPANASPFNLSDINPILEVFGLPALIPDWDLLDIDFGANYVDPDPDFLRDDLIRILNLAALFLPSPPPY